MSSKCLSLTVLTILMITIVVSPYKLLSQNALAAAPSFSRQEVLGHSGNWFDQFKGRPVTNGTNYSFIDIKSVNYFSDGKTLNATIWLADFQPIPPPDYENVNYGIYFDADFNKNTGVQGIDYKVEVGWDNKTQTWSRVIEEWGTNAVAPKTLSKPEPAINFYENGSKYVTLSADLDAMVSPDKYRVVFYAEVINIESSLSWIVDATNWVSIPPPEIIVSILPSSIDLRQGDRSTVEVMINSTTDTEIIVDLSPQELAIGGNDQKDFDLKFEPDELPISPYSIAASPLHISAFDHSSVNPHTIVIWANSSIPAESLFNQAEIDQKSDNGNGYTLLPPNLATSLTDETKLKQSTFLVQVGKWDFNDQFNAFIDQWFTPLTAVYSTITGIISGILGWIYGRRQKKGTNNNNS